MCHPFGHTTSTLTSYPQPVRVLVPVHFGGHTGNKILRGVCLARGLIPYFISAVVALQYHKSLSGCYSGLMMMSMSRTIFGIHLSENYRPHCLTRVWMYTVSVFTGFSYWVNPISLPFCNQPPQLLAQVAIIPHTVGCMVLHFRSIHPDNTTSSAFDYLRPEPSIPQSGGTVPSCRYPEGL